MDESGDQIVENKDVSDFMKFGNQNHSEIEKDSEHLEM